jgi:hypothetical protein
MRGALACLGQCQLPRVHVYEDIHTCAWKIFTLCRVDAAYFFVWMCARVRACMYAWYDQYFCRYVDIHTYIHEEGQDGDAYPLEQMVHT